MLMIDSGQKLLVKQLGAPCHSIYVKIVQTSH